MRDALKGLVEAHRKNAVADFKARGLPKAVISSSLPSGEILEAHAVASAFHEAAHALFAFLSPFHVLEWVSVEVTERNIGHTRHARRPECRVLGPGPFKQAAFEAFLQEPPSAQTELYRVNTSEVALLVAGPVEEWLHKHSSIAFDDIMNQPYATGDSKYALGYLRPMQADDAKCWGRMLQLAKRVRPVLENVDVAASIGRIAEALLDKVTLHLPDVEALLPPEERVKLVAAIEAGIGINAEAYSEPPGWETAILSASDLRRIAKLTSVVANSPSINDHAKDRDEKRKKEKLRRASQRRNR